MAGLRTQRLVLREWRDSDLEPFAALNADPEVMRYFASVMTREQSDELACTARSGVAQRGWGLWAVEVSGGPSFIGFVGLNEPGFEAPFTPAVEVGWRLARPHWGMGYATEAALAACAFGFHELGLAEIVSFTSLINHRSQRVMQRIGMRRDPAGDFEHPNVPLGPLKQHALFRITRTSWSILHPASPASSARA